MGEKHDNPQAFPLGTADGYVIQAGMTLRDYFAGRALAGILSDAEPLGDFTPEEIAAEVKQGAEFCYLCADAMLAARNADKEMVGGDDLKQAEARGYSREYQAGRKRAEVDADLALERRERARAEGLFRQQVFCAALQGTIAINGWKTGDKSWQSSRDFVRGCKNIADEAVAQFHGEIVA